MHLIYIFSKSCDQRIKDMPTKPQEMPTCGRVGARRRGQGSIGWLVPRRPVQCVLGHLPPTRCDCVLCIAAVEVESVVDRPSQDVAGWAPLFHWWSKQPCRCSLPYAGATQPRDANFFRGAHFPTGKSRRTAIILQPLVASKTLFFLALFSSLIIIPSHYFVIC